MVLIPLFLVTIILSGIVIGTMSTIKTLVDTIELAEEATEGESNNAENEVEEEEQAIFLTYEEEELARKKIAYYHPKVKLCYTVFEVLTPPPPGV